jgi:hypothetical protein
LSSKDSLSPDHNQEKGKKGNLWQESALSLVLLITWSRDSQPTGEDIEAAGKIPIFFTHVAPMFVKWKKTEITYFPQGGEIITILL